MVKVFKCHNFKSQSVVQVDGEPVAFCSNRDKLFVATGKCTIEVFSLENPVSKICSFSSTESNVHDIIHSSPGNYVATIESKTKTARRKDLFSVKVYLNWEIATSDVNNKSSVRLAGKDHTVKTSSIDESCVQVIDIPYSYKIEAIDVCQKTGNLIVTGNEVTDIYYLVEKTISNSDKLYLDIVKFLELEWHIGHVFKAVLTEDYIGVLSKNEVQVVKVLYSDENFSQSQNFAHDVDPFSSSGKEYGTPSRKLSSALSSISFTSSKSSLSLPGTPQFSKIGCRSSGSASPSLSTTKTSESFSTIEEDENFISVNLDELKSGQGQQSAKPIKTIHLKNLQEINTNKALEPIVKDLRGGGHQTAGQIKIITIYHQKCPGDHWKHLDLISTYTSGIGRIPARHLAGTVPLRSGMYNSLVGISCFVSSDSNGYLYDLWSSTPTQLSVYSYSDIPTQICMTEDLLYVLTARGVEIYTSRCGTAAIHHTDKFNTKEKAFPPANMDTCLCGVHLFMNTDKLVVSENFVIILSKADHAQRSDEGTWCLYAVEKCSPGEFFKDMVRYGEKSRKHNEGTYLNLLLEGHMMLRNTFIGSEIHDAEIQQLFRESCLLIGEYYAKEKSLEGQMCIPYLTMSGLEVTDVIRHIVDYHEKHSLQDYGQGFVTYLKHVLLQDGEPIELIEAEGDIILDICRRAIPDQLSEVILFSRVKEYNTDHALALLQSWIKELSTHGEKSSVTDKLALSHLYLDLCDPEVAENSLLLIPKVDLMKICVQHHQILHENFQQLSPLSQLLRRCCPDVLTQSLVTLHDKGIISLDLAIQLLQGTNSSEELYKNTHVKEYLELLLNDIQRRYIFDEAVHMLSEIYVKRLADQKSTIQRQRTAPQILQLPSDGGHFGRRYTWLDYLPPFKGPEEMKQPCQHIIRGSPTMMRKNAGKVKQHCGSNDTCTCALCFEDLIKFQSLLCSSCASESFVKKVAAMLDENILVPGHDSLLILVLLRIDKYKATEFVVKKHPGIVSEYGKCMMSADVKQKKIVLGSVYSTLQEQIDNPDDREPILLQSLKEILDHLARSTEPEEFINLLPDNGNFLYFLPYISVNLEQQKTQQLLQNIKDKGHQLQIQG